MRGQPRYKGWRSLGLGVPLRGEGGHGPVASESHFIRRQPYPACRRVVPAGYHSMVMMAATFISAAAQNNFDSPQAWLFVTIITAAYIVSRGIAEGRVAKGGAGLPLTAAPREARLDGTVDARRSSEHDCGEARRRERSASAVGCGWKARAKSEEELMAKVAEHAQKKHKVGTVGDTMVNYARATIRQPLLAGPPISCVT